MNADKLLERLRDPEPDGPLARLADLAADALLDTRLDELVDPPVAAAGLVELLQTHLADADAHRAIEARVADFLDELEEEGGTLGERLAPELRGALEDGADLPWAPAPHHIVAFLDREPVRRLVRRLMQESLVAFASRLPVADSRITRGLGDFGRFAREAALSRVGAFGAITAEVVGAVSGEVERQLERRAGEFADAALSGVIRRIADLLGDPALAGEQAELRRALLQGLFELEAADVAEEGRRADPARIGQVLRARLQAFVDREDAVATLEAGLRKLLGPDAARPTGDLLALWGVEELGRDLLAEFLEARLRPFVASDPFADWLRELVNED